MGDVPDGVTDTTITVRYFAAARAAAGHEEENVVVPEGTTLAELVEILSGRSTELARVLRRCSYLCDSFAIRDRQSVIETGQIVDVLPPFAGG